MESKLFELRAASTLQVILAIKISSINDKERLLLAHCGFGNCNLETERYILLLCIDGGSDDEPATTDCYKHNFSEMVTAHKYIIKYFDEINTGDVIDVDFINGFSSFPKPSDFDFSLFNKLFSKWNDEECEMNEEHDDD
jgi:hypothetical protein